MLPSRALKVPNASALKRMPVVVSSVTMTSGQCTMGASTKARVWAPVVRVSPSATTMQRSVTSMPKKFLIISTAPALVTTVQFGNLLSTSEMAELWSGSMWLMSR